VPSPPVSTRVNEIPRSGIREIMELALGIPDVIRLEIGDPDFMTPAHIIDAAAASAREGFTHYGPSIGLRSLRELIAGKVTTRNGFACSADDVAVSSGACGGLHATLLALLDPGDEVLVPDPGWTTYVPMALSAGVVPVPYALDRARDFALDLDAIELGIGPGTRAIVVNSPSNPTGYVATRPELEQVCELAERHDLWLISDECYEDIVFDREHISPASLGDPDRVISAFSFSKSYAMTGWRVGYVVASNGVAQLIAKSQEPIVSSASTISQKAAEAALLGSQDVVAEFREAYRLRRNLALALLDAEGIRYARPGGAFYIMVDVSPAGSDHDFAKCLLVDHHVAVVPGSAFGEGGRGMVRVTLAASDEAIATGLDRLCALLG
jgi:aspartate/methionine/tyrosine aminotransferase